MKAIVITREEKKNFPTLNKLGRLETTIKVNEREVKTKRGLLSRLAAKEEELTAKVNAPKVKSFRIDMEWTKGGVYGSQCKVDRAWITLEDGTIKFFDNCHKTCGCGYDKGSTTLARVLNEGGIFANIYAARNKYKKTERKPYGMRCGRNSIFTPQWYELESGVGISAICSCLEFLGFKVTHRSGKMYDLIEGERK